MTHFVDARIIQAAITTAHVRVCTLVQIGIVHIAVVRVIRVGTVATQVAIVCIVCVTGCVWGFCGVRDCGSIVRIANDHAASTSSSTHVTIIRFYR